jgi:alkanesulfonate monooxygenase SsuD/methylene tetrahydromethanopterin reductase-like flavin-dependent oxidoreductase (luciferase family)
MQRTTPKGAEVELGIFSLTDIVPGDTGAQRVRDIVDVGVYADQAGLDVFGVGEHHTPRFAVSSPAIVLAAIAARTSSITLTSAVSVLSVLDPVRLYQDFAQLDLVSGGRAEITAGRSAYAEPFEIFGVDMERYDEVFAEKLDLLRMIATGGDVTWAGRFRPPLKGAAIVPRLDRVLPVRLAVGGSPDSARRAGRLGHLHRPGCPRGRPSDGPRPPLRDRREARCPRHPPGSIVKARAHAVGNARAALDEVAAGLGFTNWGELITSTRHLSSGSFVLGSGHLLCRRSGIAAMPKSVRATQ